MRYLKVALMTFLLPLAANAEPPIFTHECPLETSQLNRPCSGSHFSYAYGDECFTLRSIPLCPSGWANLGDCVEEFGVRECTDGEAIAAGLSPTEECATSYQWCGDGGRVKCTQGKAENTSNPHATFGSADCYRRINGNEFQVSVNCKDDN